MQIKRKEREDPEIDVGSFSDIAFLLIIFFIVTTTFIKTAGNKIDIPSGSQSKSGNEGKELTILLKGNIIQIGEDQRTVDLTQLEDLLRKEDFPAKKENDRIVIVDSKPDVLYDLYFQVVNIITVSGASMALVDQSAPAGNEEK